MFHAIPVQNPVEILRQKSGLQPVFLAKEDYSFGSLMSRGDNAVITSGDTLTSKVDCNQFLNSLVDQIWTRVPWRYSRRLSVVVRPLLIFGDEDTDRVLFGVGALPGGIAHLLERIEQGHLPQDFFTSRTMRQYIGRVNYQKGHAFTQTVSDQLMQRKWCNRVEVQMTELGGPAELGDVDILAWKPGREIQIVECKRLQFARTIAEAAEVCSRFQGEAKDELAKHLRRVEWIKADL